MRNKILIILAVIMLFTASLSPITFAMEVKPESKNILKNFENINELQKNIRNFNNQVIKKKKFEQLNKDEINELRKIIEDLEILSEILENPKSDLFRIDEASAEYTTPSLARVIELFTDLYDENLTTSNVIYCIQAADIAYDDAVEYAEDHNMTKIVDNEADAFRHFSWNFIICENMGSYKTKILTDNHEFAAKAAEKYVIYPGTDDDEKVLLGIAFVEQSKEDALESESAFMSLFPEKSSYMDFYNNYRGRYYSSKTSLSRDEAFSTALGNSELIISLSQIDSSVMHYVHNTIYTGSI